LAATPSPATLCERYDEIRQRSAPDHPMKITRLEPFILHAPVTRGGIADSTHTLTHWGAPGVAIHTDAGLTGYGFSGTHAHLATDRLITDCIVNSYGPLLIGQEIGADPREIAALWEKLHKYPPIYWVGRAGITHLALGAIDIALWDLTAKHAGVPLWKLLGGSAAKKVQAYNTDGGWLNWTRGRSSPIASGWSKTKAIGPSNSRWAAQAQTTICYAWRSCAKRWARRSKS
jgi:L-alanine-DL-glutamate epimerase-like enolase superfamily enzyme